MLKNVCPICQKTLVKKNRSYSTEELFKLWKPVKFSQKIINVHKKKSLKTQLFICPNCELEIFLPQIIGTGSFYEELQQNEKAFYYEDDKWDFHEAVNDVTSGDQVMDLGCGPGGFLTSLKPLTSNLFGTECNQEAARDATKKGIKIINDRELKSFKNEFNSVFSFHVLEHVDNPAAFLKLAISLVKPGGKICISVPNQDGPIHFINPCVSNMPPHHATHWRKKTFEVLAEKMGLRIKRIVYEPLIDRDSYYYFVHWVNYKFKRDSAWGRFLNRSSHLILSIFFNLVFGLFKLIGKKTWPLFKSQALYVVMEKPEGKK